MEKHKFITEEQLIAALFLRGKKVVTKVELSKVIISFSMNMDSYDIYDSNFKIINQFTTNYKELGIMIKDEYNLDTLTTCEGMTLPVRNHLISIAGKTAIDFCELYYRNCFNCNNNLCRKEYDVNGYPLEKCDNWENDVTNILSLKKTDFSVYPQKKEIYER